MSTRTALIVIGRFKEEWHTLSPTEQNDFVASVGRTATTVGLTSIIGYRLTSTPGAFLQVWEARNRATVDRAVKNLEAIGYTRYIEARWMIGEREEPDEE